MTHKEYNGWSSYETWVVNLWINNDEGSHEFWQERAKRFLDGEEPGKLDRAIWGMSEAMKEHYEEASQDLLENANATASVWADLLGAALSEVNWYEIAEGKLAVNS